MSEAPPNGGTGGVTVESLLVASVREVKESVGQFTRDMSEQISNLSREMHQQWSNMPNAYVPRQEVRQWVDDLIVDVQGERTDRLRELSSVKVELGTQIADLKTELRTEATNLKNADTAAEERRRSDRWQGILALLALASICVALLGIVILHWK